jgi:carbamoyl-phosphate synthase large subunit
VGNLDCDVIIGRDGPQVLELNPRFGGSYPFAHQAGANLPAALLAWARGETPRPEWLRVRENVTSAKCDRLVEC